MADAVDGKSGDVVVPHNRRKHVMNTPQKTIEELRKEVNDLLASLSPREAQALKMMFQIKTANQRPDEEEASIRALLQELVAMKANKQ